jgi:hypothetical protein
MNLGAMVRLEGLGVLKKKINVQVDNPWNPMEAEIVLSTSLPKSRNLCCFVIHTYTRLPVELLRCAL